ncbi:MAG: DUF2059 domain-containing protein [Beijerinckiaceae bacterium]|nr:DUF2059 domain-containing protein [Beijerinckiaceae bacterium]
MRFISRLSGAALAAALVAGALAPSAFAQQPAPAPAQAPAPAPAPMQITQAQYNAAREVVALAGIASTYDLFYPQLAETMVGNLTRTRPELREPLIETLRALQPEFTKRNEQMFDLTARSFAGVMTEKALLETAAFFKSDAGQQYVKMQPLVIDQMMQNLDIWNRQMSEDLMSRVREEMRKKGHSL